MLRVTGFLFAPTAQKHIMVVGVSKRNTSALCQVSTQSKMSQKMSFDLVQFIILIGDFKVQTFGFFSDVEAW